MATSERIIGLMTRRPWSTRRASFARSKTSLNSPNSRPSLLLSEGWFHLERLSKRGTWMTLRPSCFSRGWTKKRCQPKHQSERKCQSNWRPIAWWMRECRNKRPNCWPRSISKSWRVRRSNWQTIDGHGECIVVDCWLHPCLSFHVNSRSFWMIKAVRWLNQAWEQTEVDNQMNNCLDWLATMVSLFRRSDGSAMCHLPDEVGANHWNPGIVTHACESLIERMLLSVTGLADISPVVHQKQRRLLRRAMKHHHRWCTTVVSNWNTFCSGSHNVAYRWNGSHSVNKHTAATPMLHAEAPFTSAERGLWTSLKCCF